MSSGKKTKTDRACGKGKTSAAVKKPGSKKYTVRQAGLENENRKLRALCRKLDAENRKYRTIVEYTTDWEYWIDPKGRYVYVSPSCESITGYPPSDFVEDPGLFVRIAHKEDLDAVTAHLAHVETGKDDRLFDFRIVNRDGEVRWIAHNCRSVYGTDGTYLGKRGSNRDITDRKLVETALAQSEAMLRKAQETAHIGSWTWRIKTDELEWSEEMSRIFGVDTETRSGDMGMLAGERIHPDDRARMEKAYKSVVGRRNAEPVEYRVVRPDGTIAWVRGIAGALVLDGQGNPESMSGIVLDITERKAVEEMLRESERRAQDALELNKNILYTSSIGILTYDESGQCTFANEAAAGIIGTSISVLLAQNYKNLEIWKKTGMYAKARETLKRGAEQALEVRTVTTFGREVWLDVSLSTFRFNEKKLLLVLLHDMTARRKAEASLRESEKRYKTLFDAVPEPIFIVDAESGALLDSNPAASGKYGFSPEEFRDLCIADLCAEYDEAKPSAVFPGIGSVRYAPHRKKNGESFAADISSNFLEIGGASMNVVVVRDVTERIASEEAIRKSEARFRALIEHSHDAIALISGNGTVLYDSPSIEHVLGWIPGERTGRRVWDFVHPDDRRAMQKGFAEFVEHPGAVVPSFQRFLHKDGTIRYVEGVRTNLIGDPAVGAVVVNYRDVTEKKIAYDRLRESEEKYRTLSESINIGIFQSTLDGRFLYANSKLLDMAGCASVEELAAVPAMNLYADAAERKKLISALTEEGSVKDLELKAMKGNGSLIWIAMNAVLIKTTTGEPLYILGSIVDISDRKEAEARAESERTRAEHYLDIAEIMILALDKDGNVTLINRKGCEILGFDRVEIVGRNWFETFLARDGKSEASADYARFMTGETGAAHEFVYTAVTKHRTLRVISGVVTLTCDPGGSISGSLGSGADVTDQRIAESRIRHLSTFPELDPDPVIEVTVDGEVSYANEAARTALADSGYGFDILRFFGDDPTALLGTAVRNRGALVQREERIGGRIFAETIEYLEELDRVRLYATEITKRRQAEDSLRISEVRYRELFNNISSGVAIYEITDDCEDFVFKDFNKAGERMDNEKKEDLVGRRVLEMRPGLKEFGLFDVFKRVWRTGASEHFPTRFYKDHRLVGWYDNFVYKLQTGEIVQVFDNVTQKKKAEEELLISEEKYRILFENMQEGFSHCRMLFEDGKPADFVYLDVNDKFGILTGLKDVKGRRVSEVVPGICGKDPGLFTVYGRVVDTGIPEKFEYYFNSLSMWLSISVFRPFSNHFVAMFDVITERKRIEEALVRREKELSNLSARLMQVREEERVKIARNVHDDIGHAVMLVKMDVFLMERCMQSGAGTADAIESIKQHLDGVVESIQRISLEIRPPMLYDLGIADALSFFIKRFSEQTGIRCEVDISADIPVMQGDRSIAVYRIIQEAFTNVYRHADAHEIRFSMSTDGLWLVVEIADDGKGIEDGIVDNVQSLGLLGMKERTHILGGRIEIVRRTEGGTRITVRVPIDLRE